VSRLVLAVGPEGLGPYECEFRDGRPSLRRSNGSPEILLSPGLVDVHIHGAFGADFMDADPGALLALASRLEGLGYEAALLTTVACRAADALRALDAIPSVPVFAGAHLEGPFLSRAYPGAQPPGAILDPADAGPEWDAVFDHPRLRLATIAPERPGAPELARRLRSRGVTVSMGHTDAAFDVVERLAEVTHATHCFNAMRPLHHREPGAAGAALVLDRIAAELVYDRVHVSRAAAEVLVRCKPLDKLVGVSDGTRASGMPDGARLDMWGQPAVVRGGSVRLEGSGALAGSAVTLLDVFRNLHDDFGAGTAVRACALNPRPAAGLPGTPTRWLLFDRRLEIAEILGDAA
jgi:N-acetylglucosamine-6-phosphate deacetylase